MLWIEKHQRPRHNPEGDRYGKKVRKGSQRPVGVQRRNCRLLGESALIARVAAAVLYYAVVDALADKLDGFGRRPSQSATVATG